MTDRDFWIAVRQALLGIVSAIERRWQLGKYSKKVLDNENHYQ